MYYLKKNRKLPRFSDGEKYEGGGAEGKWKKSISL